MDAINTILITGATGFVGQALTRHFLKQGKTVLAWSRSAQRAQALLGNTVLCIERLDEIDDKGLRVDAVVNLAGERILGWPWTKNRRNTLLKSRVGLTQELVAWMGHCATPPRLLLSASAIGYYGIQARGDSRALCETDLPQDIFMSTLCQEWERAARAAQDFGVQVATLRFGLVLGRGGALPVMLWPIRLGLGGSLAGGQQWLSWIHLNDVVGALDYLLQQFSSPSYNADSLAPSYNFTAPDAVLQQDFSRTAAKILHRPCFLPTPGWPMRLVLGEQADLLLEGQRVAPQNLLKDGYTFQYPKLEAALKSLII